MPSNVLVGCSGWNYGDQYTEGGWVGSFYPDTKTRRLSYYSHFFDTAEMDATFYEKFYSKMSPGTFYGMAKATPPKFQFSVKVPETVTHKKRLDVKNGAADALAEFLEKIEPLKHAAKLGAILVQLPPSFSVRHFKETEAFLEQLPQGYEYAVEFRHSSWQTEGPWEMLAHYNVAGVITDSPDPQLQFLSDLSLTANHAFIRLHGRNRGYWYNYLYDAKELETWVSKIKNIQEDSKVKTLRIYFNNHYGAKAVENALEFRQLLGEQLSAEEESARLGVRQALANLTGQKKIGDFK